MGFVHGPGQFALRRGHSSVDATQPTSRLRAVNYDHAVIIDTDDLLDSTEVAEILGLSSARAISVYRARYDSFPEPVVVKAGGRLLLWHRREVESWRERPGSSTGG